MKMNKKLPSVLILLTSLTPLILIPTLNDPTRLPKLVWIFILTALLLTFNIRERLFSSRNTFILPVLLILLWNLVSIHRSTNVYESINAVVILLLFITFYLTMENLLTRKTVRIETFLNYILLVSAIVSIYGILQITGWDFLHWELKHSPLSTLGRRNFAAEYLVMIIPYLYYLIYSTKQRSKRILAILLLFLFITHLGFTFTRASYIAFFFSSLFFILTVMNKRRTVGLKISVVLLILLTLTRPSFSSSTTFQPGTVKSRLLIWNITFKMIADSPVFGVGLGNFSILYSHYAVGETAAVRGKSINIGNVHNDYLETSAETGIPGLLLFLYLLFTAAKTAFVLYKKSGRNEKLLIAGIAASVVAISFNALASFPFKNPSTSLLFWANLAFLGAMYRKEKQVTIKVPHQILGVYLVIFLLTGLTLSYRAILSSSYMFKAKNSGGLDSLKFAEVAIRYNPLSFESFHYAGTVNMNMGNYEKAYDYLIKAKKMHPYFDSIHNNLGMVYLFTGHPEEAEQSFLTALRLNPESPEFNNNLGFLYVNTGRPEQSIRYLHKAISLKQDFYLAHFSLGMAYYLKNDQKEAEKYFRKTIEINPSFQPAREYLKKLKTSNF